MKEHYCHPWSSSGESGVQAAICSKSRIDHREHESAWPRAQTPVEHVKHAGPDTDLARFRTVVVDPAGIAIADVKSVDAQVNDDVGKVAQHLELH
ncbi:MAG: hypothetical protein R2770_12505 [Acidimicrobiales bacterium]